MTKHIQAGDTAGTGLLGTYPSLSVDFSADLIHPQLLYNQLTQKAGDTITASTVGTTETMFASKVTLAASKTVSTGLFRVDFMGMYTSSTLVVPTLLPRIKLGTVAIIATPALSNPAGATGLGFSGYVLISVVNGTATNNIESSGVLSFASSTTASVMVNVPATVSSIDFSTAKDLGLSVQYSNNQAGNNVTLQQLAVQWFPTAIASN